MRDDVITIDGPCGAGKSTIGRLLAERLNYTYIDSGAMYRVVALKALEKGISLNDEAALSELCANLSLSFSKERVILEERDVTKAIRRPEIGLLASKISQSPTIRKRLGEIQRERGKKGRIILEGRDSGTVIFPEARTKFYLTARLEVRGKRRYKQLATEGSPSPLTLEEVAEEIRKRDHQDSTRNLAPLKVAESAVIIDSTFMSIEAVVEKMLEILKKEIPTSSQGHQF